jgi:peptidoglycan L-alanyl-D-glutamate endopeptidase CwlK
MTARFSWGKTSLYNLKGIHPDLRTIADRALYLSPIDFRIVDGLRTLAEQRENVKKGVSKTMNSRHLTGHAIDFAVLKLGEIDWHDLTGFGVIGQCFLIAEKELKIPVDWGGDWKWKDWGHIQLSWSAYPK